MSVKEDRRVWIGSTAGDCQRSTMSVPCLTGEAVIDSKKDGSGRDRGPTRQARGDQASGQPGSEISVVSVENKPVLRFPDSGRVLGVYDGDHSSSYKQRFKGCKLVGCL